MNTTAQKMIWTPEQQEIFEVTTDSDVNVVIRATAGSGKSTTGLQVMRLLAKQAQRTLSKTAFDRYKMIYVAFNTKIVDAMEPKLKGERIDVKTLHSVGFYAIRRYLGAFDTQAKKLVLQKNKAYQFALDVVKTKKDIHPNKIGKVAMDVAKLADAWRLNLCRGIDDLWSVLERNGVDADEAHVAMVPKVIANMAAYNSRTDFSVDTPMQVDFCDMVYLPATIDAIQPVKYDIVLIDEAQDANPVMQLLIRKMLKPSSRFFAIGDPDQSIYGFMGADPAAFENFLSYPNTIELPLSVTFRCPKKIVAELASMYSDNIVAHDNNIEGEITQGDLLKEGEPGDIVLCRNNKPLFDAWIELTARRKKAFISEEELGKRLIKMVEDHLSKTLEQLFIALNKQLETLLHELRESQIENPTMHPRYIARVERIQILRRLAEEVDTVSELHKMLSEIFHDQGEAAIRLMTMHGAKGLEAPRVFIIRWDLVPSKRATTAEMMLQERHLQFVAVTRAMQRLTFDTNIQFGR